MLTVKYLVDFQVGGTWQLRQGVMIQVHVEAMGGVEIIQEKYETKGLRKEMRFLALVSYQDQLWSFSQSKLLRFNLDFPNQMLWDGVQTGRFWWAPKIEDHRCWKDEQRRSLWERLKGRSEEMDEDQEVAQSAVLERV